MLDTPGHVDFLQMERGRGNGLRGPVISCGGIQGHTETVWRLLKHHRVPVFLFLNKTDRAGGGSKAGDGRGPAGLAEMLCGAGFKSRGFCLRS